MRVLGMATSMIPSSVARFFPRARTASGTPSTCARLGSVPVTSMTLPAARARIASWLRPRATVASGDISRATSVNGVSRSTPDPVTPTACPMRALVERIVSSAACVSSRIRGSR